MNHLFEVQSTINIAELRLAYHVFYFKKNKRWTIFGIVLGIFILLGAISRLATMASHDRSVEAIALVLGVVALVLPFYKVHVTAKRVYKNHKTSNLPLQTTLLISESGIKGISEQATSITKWNQFSDGYLYNNQIILVFGNSFMVINPANTLKGSPYDLLQFVNSKVPLKGYIPQLQQRGSTSRLKGNPDFIRTLLFILFILSFCALYFALWLVSTRTSGNQNQTTTENMWLFFLPLPIPLASLVLGIIYKRKSFKTTKNIVVGIIFSALLVLNGSSTFIFSDMYSHDFSYVNQIESQIDFELPDTGDITLRDWTIGTQTEPDPGMSQYFYTSDIIFTDNNEISHFNTEISQSDLWLKSVNTTLIGLVPSMYSYLPSSSQYDYFMIYNVDLKTYNTMPESSGTYGYVFIAYNSTDGTMEVGEYALAVIV